MQISLLELRARLGMSILDHLDELRTRAVRALLGILAGVGVAHPEFAVFVPRLQDVFDTYVKMLVGMAIAFQMPPVVYLLARMRLVTARWLARRTKYAVLVIAVAAAILTPSPDPFNQALYAAPMFALYLLSIGVAWLAHPNR